MMFFVDTDTSSGGFGTSAFSNVPRFALAWMLNGNLTRTRDIANQTGLPSIGAHVCLREPTSGTYTTTEFTIPRSVEVNSTQELNVNPATENPLNFSAASGGTRQRVVGSGEMVATVGAVPDSLGYAFWSTTLRQGDQHHQIPDGRWSGSALRDLPAESWSIIPNLHRPLSGSGAVHEHREWQLPGVEYSSRSDGSTNPNSSFEIDYAGPDPGSQRDA